MSIERKIRRNSDLLAFFIAETLLCSMVSKFVNIPLLSVIFTLIIIAVLAVNNRRICVRRLSMVFVGVVFVVLMLSILKNGIANVTSYAMHFCCFGLSAFFFSTVTVSPQRTIQTLIKIYITYLVVYVLFIRTDFLHSENYWNTQMGTAYGFVPIILLAALIQAYPQLYVKNKMHSVMVFLMGVLACAFLLFDTGTRGALVTVFIGIVCIMLTKQNNWKKTVLIIVGGVFLIVCALYYREIVIMVADVLSNFEVEIGAVNKMVFMIEQGNEFNGRDELGRFAQEYFLQSPLFGQGVGYFESKEGTYPHSLMWQLLCEYGIVGTIFISIYLLKRVADLFFSKGDDNRHIELLMFLSSVPMLFFSNTYWQIPLFWVFFFNNESDRKPRWRGKGMVR